MLIVFNLLLFFALNLICIKRKIPNNGDKTETKININVDIEGWPLLPYGVALNINIASIITTHIIGMISSFKFLLYV